MTENGQAQQRRPPALRNIELTVKLVIDGWPDVVGGQGMWSCA